MKSKQNLAFSQSLDSHYIESDYDKKKRRQYEQGLSPIFPHLGNFGEFQNFQFPIPRGILIGELGKNGKNKNPNFKNRLSKNRVFSSIGRVFNQIAINIRFLLVLIPFSSISPGEFRSRNHAILRSKGNYFQPIKPYRN